MWPCVATPVGAGVRFLGVRLGQGGRTDRFNSFHRGLGRVPGPRDAGSTGGAPALPRMVRLPGEMIGQHLQPLGRQRAGSASGSGIWAYGHAHNPRSSRHGACDNLCARIPTWAHSPEGVRPVQHADQARRIRQLVDVFGCFHGTDRLRREVVLNGAGGGWGCFFGSRQNFLTPRSCGIRWDSV